ncbi:MAG: TetR/AcrR family transcriptional regulator C-terminal domain-containing protein [Asticcacaulis sp.]|uniref:TetR/AcrR family transcriptional regulator C-terminal domain-containing protein n=1 Tax=Asticcacaulis sp. TaxID=1872648 RepID=UPI0039E411F4
MRLLIAEARAFPDLAIIWHDKVVSKILGVLTGAIERAQERGEMKAGDPRLYAFSILGPMLAGVLFQQIFAETDVLPPDLGQLAEQHGQAILNGLLVSKG